MLKHVDTKEYKWIKKLIEDSLYNTVNKFNEEKISNKNLYTKLLTEIYNLYDGNERTSKIIFVNDPSVINLVKNKKI